MFTFCLCCLCSLNFTWMWSILGIKIRTDGLLTYAVTLFLFVTVTFFSLTTFYQFESLKNISKSEITMANVAWFQKEITLKEKSRGCHLITSEIEKVEDIKKIKIGLCHVLVKHTTASLCLNENWDSDVRSDMEYMLNKLVPETMDFQHTLEGPDDMPSHVKTALLGASVTMPITNGKLNLGQWQGLWLCEHRNHGGNRKLVVTIQGTLE